jgi:hypothetical protein
MQNFGVAAEYFSDPRYFRTKILAFSTYKWKVWVPNSLGIREMITLVFLTTKKIKLSTFVPGFQTIWTLLFQTKGKNSLQASLPKITLSYAPDNLCQFTLLLSFFSSLNTILNYLVCMYLLLLISRLSSSIEASWGKVLHLLFTDLFPSYKFRYSINIV